MPFSCVVKVRIWAGIGSGGGENMVYYLSGWGHIPLQIWVNLHALIAVECTGLKKCMTVMHVTASSPDTLTASGTVCDAMATFPEQELCSKWIENFK